MKEEKEKIFKLKLLITFKFVHWKNVVDVGTALAKSGYFINITQIQEVYHLNIYTF